MQAEQPKTRSTLDYEPIRRNLWHVGTLTYTGGALAVLFCWLLWGDFAWSMKERAIAPIMPLLLDTHGVSPTMVALLLASLPAAIGLFLGPVISFRSDRLRTRFGRRIPILMITTPVAASAMIGLAFSPRIGAALADARMISSGAGFLLSFGLFWAIFEFATIAANSVFGALINDVVPHQLLGRFFGLFRALSLIAGIIFSHWLMGKAETWYVWMLCGFALLYAVGFSLMCLKVKEGEYPPPEIIRRPGVIASAKVYLSESFTIRYYWWVFAAMVVAGMTFSPINTYSLQFARSLGMDLGFYGDLIALSYAVSLCLAFFLGWLADRFHPLRVGIAALMLYAVCTAWGAIYATTPGRMGIALVGHVVISGTYFTTTASLSQRLFPRLKFAQYASAGGILSAIAGMVFTPAFGKIIELTGKQYRHTYLMSCILCCIAIGLLLIVHYHFMRLGGAKSYVAPERNAGEVE